MSRPRIAIVVFDEVEVLDFAGPFEVLSALRLDEATRRDSASPYEVIVAGVQPGLVHCRGGLKVQPDTTIAELDPAALDTLLVPGGYGVRPLLQDAAFLAWLRRAAPQPRRLASVCTGSLLLAEAGQLDGVRATTHWKSLDWMARDWPSVQVQRERHWVVDGRVATSAGISAGIDLSLKLIEADFGEDLARATAAHMEYPWPESDARRLPES
ncbi:DJ-1/PfpI family protein [Silanimonas sp.]|uniref:DJ-1/PfpI family protein n=1 Tax=Silanimonas sp. TaxID=1929290 RepID=UPI0037C6FBA4